jgi:hypothetical protein
MSERLRRQWGLLKEKMSAHNKAAIITAKPGIASWKWQISLGASNRLQECNSTRFANEIPFAPCEGFVDACEMCLR